MSSIEVFGLDDHGSRSWLNPVTSNDLKLRVKEILKKIISCSDGRYDGRLVECQVSLKDPATRYTSPVFRIIEWDKIIIQLSIPRSPGP